MPDSLDIFGPCRLVQTSSTRTCRSASLPAASLTVFPSCFALHTHWILFRRDSTADFFQLPLLHLFTEIFGYRGTGRRLSADAHTISLSLSRSRRDTICQPPTRLCAKTGRRRVTGAARRKPCAKNLNSPRAHSLSSSTRSPRPVFPFCLSGLRFSTSHF